MRTQYHWSLKLTAFILVMVSACLLALSGACVIYNANNGMYGDMDLEEKIQSEIQDHMDGYLYETAAKTAADYLMHTYTEENSVEQSLWSDYFNPYWNWNDFGGCDDYEIRSSAGVVLANGGSEGNGESAASYVRVVYMEMGTIVDLGPDKKDFPLWGEWGETSYQWTDFYGNELPDLDSRTIYYDLCHIDNKAYRIEYFENIELEVEIFLTQDRVNALAEQTDGILLMKTCYRFRDIDIVTAVVSAIVLIASTVYLCFAAGKCPGTMEIRPRGTNRLPLDLLGGAGFFAVVGLMALGACSLRELVWCGSWRLFQLYVLCYSLAAMGMALLCTLFLTAFFAQARMGRWEWLKRTVLGRCWLWCWGGSKRVWNSIFGSETAEKGVGLIPRAIHWIRGAHRSLPLMWQWLGLFAILFVLTLWVASTFRYHGGTAFLIVAVVGFLIVLYTGYGFGKLRDSAKRMSEGDLDTKIDCHGEFLYGNFAEFADDLNALGDACVEAALAKMKSERMRSELITNVSHDIKTPLTSIINYVDLLQRAETEEQRAQYLEVLDRQSQRLKKLIEDLMEMSKASSGNISVELSENDLIEAVNQALGEFSDRFSKLDLRIVFRQADQSIQARFDGKLLWRVLSNCFGNVCKYALPGTRVYVDVEVTDRNVLLSIKNISREPLNIPAEELMERFVRGDASRNDQGNGLGLNIAKSLMEAQGGSLDLTVDGDLFKVILTLN